MQPVDDRRELKEFLEYFHEVWYSGVRPEETIVYISSADELSERIDFKEDPILEINLSVSSALRSPDAEHWKGAITTEKGRLRKFETYGDPLSFSQLREITARPGFAAIPLVIVLARKRSGQFKLEEVNKCFAVEMDYYRKIFMITEKLTNSK